MNERSGFMYGLAIGDGTVYYATARLPTLSIQKSDGDGFITTVFEDVPGRFGGAFSDYVPGLALAPDGTLYAVDWQYGRVVRISPDGEAALVVDRDWFNIPALPACRCPDYARGRAARSRLGHERDLEDHAPG